MRTWMLVLALHAFPANAAVRNAPELTAIEARLKSCIDKDSSNFSMKMCTNAAYEAADRALNKVYRSVTTELKTTQPGETPGEDGKEKLRRLVKAEAAWIAYRDAECDLQGIEMLGGTGEGLTVIGCLYELTKQRTKSLSDLFEAK